MFFLSCLLEHKQNTTMTSQREASSRSPYGLQCNSIRMRHYYILMCKGPSISASCSKLKIWNNYNYRVQIHMWVYQGFGNTMNGLPCLPKAIVLRIHEDRLRAKVHLLLFSYFVSYSGTRNSAKST